MTTRHKHFLLLATLLHRLHGQTRTNTICACVLTGFADGGTHLCNHNHAATVHMYITLHLLQKQGQTPLRMRIDGFCRWWDTYLQPQSCCYGPHVYYASSTAINKDKRHCACVLTGFADGGTHISNHNHAATVHMYITRYSIAF